MKFYEFVLQLHLTFFVTRNYTHRDKQTDRYFPCSGYFKACKSSKNRKSKIFTNPILFSIYIEERKKKEIKGQQRTESATLTYSTNSI